MGNHTSSSSVSSSSSIRKRFGKHNQSNKDSTGDAGGTSRVGKSPLQKSSSLGSYLSSLDSPDNSTKIKRNSSFHYNIHQPTDLISENENPENENDPTVLSVSKRNSAATEFVKGKSPLRDYLRDKFTNHHHHKNGTTSENNKQSQPQGEEEVAGESNPLRPPPFIPPSQQQQSIMNSNVERLTKLLVQESNMQKENKISQEVVKKLITSGSPILAEYLCKYLLDRGSKNSNTINATVFITMAEKVFMVHTDKDELVFYLKIFSTSKDMMDKESFLDFLHSCYQLSTLGEQKSNWKVDLSSESEYFEALVKSCYHIKDEMSLCFITNWLLTNLPRGHIPLHKFMCHQMTTGYAQLSSGNTTINCTQGGGVSRASIKPEVDEEEEKVIEEEQDQLSLGHNKLSPVLMWLLKSSIPAKFLDVFNQRNKPDSNHARLPAYLTAVNSAQLLMQLMHQSTGEPEPPSWDLLYNSDNDGLSVNRFQHHVFNYRGPTFMMIYCDGYTFGLAVDTEWKESCHFWGGEDATLVQIQPEFRIVEKGSKLVYVNFSIRGYPFAIQAGKDPKNISLDVKPDFSYVSFKKIPCQLSRFEVWGCAKKETQVQQTEYKKWEVKQCENIRKVNLTVAAADWKDNPDKYLLELAGNYRSYNN